MCNESEMFLGLPMYHSTSLQPWFQDTPNNNKPRLKLDSGYIMYYELQSFFCTN